MKYLEFHLFKNGLINKLTDKTIENFMTVASNSDKTFLSTV